jgi:nucleotide-binding universal stress UspA family protein
VLGYDGSPAADLSVRRTADLLHGDPALVVVVWEAGLPFELFQPTIPPAPIDIRAALQLEETLRHRAQQLAEHGATLARDLGLKAEGLAVVDDVTVAQTLVRLAEERDARAIAVGAHGHSAVRELVVGSTTREVVRTAPCPVIVTRAPADSAGARSK